MSSPTRTIKARMATPAPNPRTPARTSGCDVKREPASVRQTVSTTISAPTTAVTGRSSNAAVAPHTPKQPTSEEKCTSRSFIESPLGHNARQAASIASHLPAVTYADSHSGFKRRCPGLAAYN
eukprot:scaffold136017_cov30-Tisochrysis_lutea.AAC.4